MISTVWIYVYVMLYANIIYKQHKQLRKLCTVINIVSLQNQWYWQVEFYKIVSSIF